MKPRPPQKKKMSTLFIILMISFVPLPGVQSVLLNLDRCNNTLGLESGDLADSALSASSSFDEHSTGPQNARLNRDRNGGAWCPSAAISQHIKEWLQIDLDGIHVITAIITQGRYGKGKGQEYVQKFLLEYRRKEKDNAADWRVYSDKKGNQIFDANSDTTTAALTRLDPPLFADRVRIVPFSVHPRIVCLRFELHGCKDQRDIIGYSSPPPDLTGTTNVTLANREQWWADLDSSVLADGSFGESALGQVDIPSYSQGWMGWKRRRGKTEPVEVVFEFAAVKQFNRVDVFAANRYDLNVKVFSRALIWFSVGGSRFRPDPVAFEYMPDGAIRESRNISIPIKPSQPGKFVKIQFFFDDIWMLMSEISFDWTDRYDVTQTAAPFDVVTKKRSSDPAPAATITTTIKPPDINDYDDNNNNKKNKNEVGVVEEIVETETSSKSVYMEIVVGVLTATCLLLLFLFLIVVAYSRRQKFLNSPASRSLNPFPVQINMKDLLMNLSPSSQAGGTGGGLSHQLAAVSSASPQPANITLNPNYSTAEDLGSATTSFYRPQQPQHPITFDEQFLAEDARTKWFSTGHVPDPTSIQGRFSFRNSNNNVCSEYASVDVIADHQQFPHPVPPPPPPPAPAPAPAAAAPPTTNSSHHFPQLHYRSLLLPHPQTAISHANNSAVLTAATVQRGGGGSGAGAASAANGYNLGNYFPRVSSEPPTRKAFAGNNQKTHQPPPPPLETVWNVAGMMSKQQLPHVSIEEIPRSQLKIKESLGRGCLGEVLLCEIESAYSNMPQTVAVRSCSAAPTDREDFLRECRLLAGLNHSNVARLVGVCVSSSPSDDIPGPYCSIHEHSQQGDLYHYLRQADTSRHVGRMSAASSASSSSASTSLTEAASSSASTSVSFHRLLDFCAQIASGMKYLEGRNLLHKDLAARNCILTLPNQVVKVTDVAMGISLYNGDYGEVRGRQRAPIRWQAWETLLMGRLTPSSNVWSFGVTAWEVFSLCRNRPLANLTDVEVLQNAEHFYFDDALQTDLKRPEVCEKDVWSLLQECWNREEKSRPNFAEILLFLKRKAMNFDLEV